MNNDASRPDAQPLGDTRTAFITAMRKVAATISLVTTCEDGSAHGMTATAISSLSADPPAILVCIKRSASIHGPLNRVKWFCINLLGEQHEDLFNEFTARQGADRFTVGDWAEGPHRLPCLKDAAAALICRLVQPVDYGTHTICIARVDSVTLAGSARPLLYQDGGSGGFVPLRRNVPSRQDIPPRQDDPPPPWALGSIIYPVADLTRAIAFYRDVVGLRLKFQDGDKWAAFDFLGTTLALEHRNRDDETARRIRVGLKVSQDLETVVDKLRCSGASIGPIRSGAHEHTTTLTDPDGNQTMLYSPLARRQA
jgi:flavin reductase (DIM6/NTAB) family NADH-FMN oxidoreductase RutF/catechol 2,3-dioxygenase-like lactoylglutathione lyase family enzyme